MGTQRVGKNGSSSIDIAGRSAECQDSLHVSLRQAVASHCPRTLTLNCSNISTEIKK